jgi:hypothetical protein
MARLAVGSVDLGPQRDPSIIKYQKKAKKSWKAEAFQQV